MAGTDSGYLPKMGVPADTKFITEIRIFLPSPSNSLNYLLSSPNISSQLLTFARWSKQCLILASNHAPQNLQLGYSTTRWSSAVKFPGNQ